jgi:DNA-binding NarL/FixJ family response regulator
VTRARVLLADDHKEMRDRVSQLLGPKFEVVGEVENGYALLDAASKMKPDLCIMDISMPVMNGIEASAKLNESGSHTKIVILTVHDDIDFAKAALSAGALAYVVKAHMASELLPAIEKVLRGGMFVSPSCGIGNHLNPGKE